jgi:TolB-like protein
MTRSLRLTCIALFVCASAGIAAAKPSIAILGLEVVDKSGVPTNDDITFAKSLTEGLRGRAKISGPYSLANGADKELIDLKLLKGCDDDKNMVCMASIGSDLNADFLMYGSVTKKGGNYEITVSLLDVHTKKREKTAPSSVVISGAAGQIPKVSQKIYNGLTGQTDSCTITVKTPGVDRATILVGSKESGNITNGVGTVTGLGEGKYSVSVEAKDYHRWTKTDVQCTGGETTNIQADLSKMDKGVPPVTTVTDPNAGPPGNTTENHEITGSISHPTKTNTWKYVAIGSGVLTAASAVTLIIYRQKLQGLHGAVWSPGSDCTTEGDHFSPSSPADCKNAGTWSNLTIASGIGTAVFGGITIYSIVKAVKNGDSNSDEHAALGRRKHHEPFAVTPVVSPTGAGATFRMEW